MRAKRIEDAFKNGKAFIPFITAGDPSIEKTEEYILAMERAGADLIEIGIPFSDPIAEGVVIQEADLRSLEAGTTTDSVFEMVGRLREKTDMPLVFMTYLNIVFYYGYEKFFTNCEKVGISGIIIPDMPYEEKGECESIAAAHGVDIVSMVAPTSEDRIKMIAGESKGFLYVVSSMGVTGVRSEITTDLGSIMKAVRASGSKTPAAIGFGISTPEQAKKMASIADGVIVGSAIVKLVAKYGDQAEQPIYDFVKSMKDAIRTV
ncbi:MAG: tryptophan synthase subunit alpha [Eubacteriales bacterium]